MSKRMERAKALRADPNVHYNCAQSVLIPFAADCGLTEEQANRLGAHFGSGMKMGATCGAITGALMVLGMMGGGDEAYRALMAAERESHANVVDCAGPCRAGAGPGMTPKQKGNTHDQAGTRFAGRGF